jgi:hypothetical protein
LHLLWDAISVDILSVSPCLGALLILGINCQLQPLSAVLPGQVYSQSRVGSVCEHIISSQTICNDLHVLKKEILLRWRIIFFAVR